MNDKRFSGELQKTYEHLRKEYEHWQYATYKPQGIDNVIDSIIDAMHDVEELINNITDK